MKRHTRHLLTCVGIGIVTLLIAAPASAQSIVYVDDDAPLGGNGFAWATAHRFLQDGLTQAADSMGVVEEIRVGQGMYRPDRDTIDQLGTGDRDATFQLLDGVSLLGGYAGFGADDADARDIALYETILSGDLLGNDVPDFVNYDENSYHVVTGSGTDLSAVIDGLTITGGRANGTPWPAFGTLGAGMINESGSPTVRHCTFSANWARGFGGAMENFFGASPHISDCVFIGNQVSPGDGGFATGGAIDNFGGPEPVITDCEFEDNVVRGVGADVRGGAIYLEGQWANPDFETGSLTLTGCTFVNNAAEDGGGAEAWGGAVVVAEASAKFERCTFTGNGALGGNGYGAAVLATEAHGAVFIECTFSGNEAHWGAALYLAGIGGQLTNCVFAGNIATNDGGAIYALSWPEAGLIQPTVINCLFQGNTAADEGGAIITNQLVQMSLANCTIEGNSAPSGSALRNENGATTTARNCVFWDNVGGSLFSGAAPLITYSDVQVDWLGDGNISADPLFIAPGGGNGRLQPGSPCIDAGHNNAVPPDTQDLDDDGDVIESTPVDLDGNPRFADDDTKDDTGCGVPFVVDMGAYEMVGTPAQRVIAGDTNGDGQVTVVDLLSLLGNWGPVDGCVAADTNLDNVVDVVDLLRLLANWS